LPTWPGAKREMMMSMERLSMEGLRMSMGGSSWGSGERKAVKMNKKRRNEMAIEIAEIKEMKEMLGQMVEEMSGWW